MKGIGGVGEAAGAEDAEARLRLIKCLEEGGWLGGMGRIDGCHTCFMKLPPDRWVGGVD